MSNSNKGKISIANIIALIGLAAIGVVSFFGILLHSSDGKPTIAVLGSLALVATLGILLFMSIKAKGAEDNPDKWRFVEWVCLGLYVVVALLFATSFLRFFFVVSEKETMQAQAKQEINAIKTLYSEYEHQYKKFIDDTVEQMKNYIDSGQESRIKDSLSEYMKKIGSNIDGDGGWKSKAIDIVKMPKDEQLIDMGYKIDRWDYLQLPSLAKELETKESTAWTNLEERIKQFGEKNGLIPVIGGGGSQPYKLMEGYAKFELGKKPEAKFADMLREANGSTIIGWVVYVFLNLLVLLNYAVASRSSFVGPRRHKGDGNTGGLDL